MTLVLCRSVFTKELFTLTSLTSDLVCLETPKSCPGPLAAAMVLQTFLSPNTHSHPHHCDQNYQLSMLFAGSFLMVSLWQVASQIGSLLIVDWIISPILLHQEKYHTFGSGSRLVLVLISCFSIQQTRCSWGCSTITFIISEPFPPTLRATVSPMMTGHLKKNQYRLHFLSNLYV